MNHAPADRFARLYSLLGWLALGGLVLVGSLPKASTIVFTWPWAFYSQALLLVPVFLLTWTQARGWRGVGLGGLAGLVLAGVIGVSVAASRQPHFSFEAALPLWGALAWIFWLAGQLGASRAEVPLFLRFARVAGVAMTVSLVMSAFLYAVDVGHLLAEQPWGKVDWVAHRNPHPLGHWNYTGGLGLLTFPWLAGLVWYERRWWRAGWIVASALAATAFFTAASRGAVLGALAAAAVAGLLWLSLHRPSRRQWVGLGLATVLVVAGLLATNGRLRALVADPSILFQRNESDVQRIGMLQGGGWLGLERPWVGHGPGMVPFVYPEVRARLVGGVETSYQLHNAPLHWWATTGFVGLAALGAFLCILGREWWRWRREPAGAPRTFALLGGVALAGYAGLALTDYQLDVITLLALAGLWAGMLLARPADADGFGAGRRGRWLPWVLGVAGAGAVAVLAPHWRAHQLHWTALAETSVEETSVTERVVLARRLLASVDAAPWCAHYRNQAGFQLARAAGESGDAGLRQAARRVLASSLEIDAAQEPVQSALGWLWLPDDPAPARAHFSQALRLLPDRPSTHLGLALACLGAGDERGCVQALAMELLVNPAFVASPYWQQSPLRELRDPAYARWRELSARALADPELPVWRRPAFAYACAVARWWREGRMPGPDELAGAGAEVRAVFAAIAQEPRGDVVLPGRWAALREVLAAPVCDEADLRVRCPELSDAARAALWLRLKTPGVASLAALLRMPFPEGGPVVHMKLERGHYPLMHRSLDGPGYADLAPYMDDPFLLECVAPLFPARGLLPGPVVTRLESAE